MYTLLVFLFKDVDFPQVAVLGAFFALMQKEKRTNYYKNKCFIDTMTVVDVESFASGISVDCPAEQSCKN